MVDTKQALKMLWKDKCKITIKDQEIFDPESKTTSYADSVLVENEPCKLSFETLSTSSEDAVKAKIIQKAKLFIKSEIIIPPGSIVEVTRGTRVFVFSATGLPGVFSNHQEIMLETEDFA
ncbi:MAG: hypothetical protein KH020_07235 [Clostridiales bacterium]|nr:hypothetical protein [Clostridiales bacterium]